MLSIKKISSAPAAANYFQKDDYYLKDERDAGEGAGHWVGKGAAALGLVGKVEKEQFLALLKGNLPNGVQLGRTRGDEVEHVPGWDLTLSVPKTVSLMHLVGGDERITDAINTAAMESFTYVESQLAVSRVLVNGDTKYGRTGNLVSAWFHHQTSRDGQPQDHIHMVVMNATQRADDTWGSLHSINFFDAQKTVGVLFQNRLSYELQKLGFVTEFNHRNGTFEVVGVDREYVMANSTRRQAIEAMMDEIGRWDRGAAELAALKTRDRSQSYNRDELLSKWRLEAEKHGLDFDSLVKDSKERVSARDPEAYINRGEGFLHESNSMGLDEKNYQQLYRIVNRSIKAVSEQQTTFTVDQLLFETARRSAGRFTAVEMRSVIRDIQKNGVLVEASILYEHAHLPTETRAGFTTRSAIIAEQQILNTMKLTKGTREAFFDAGEADRLLAEVMPSNATDGQRAAAKMILTTTDRIVGVQGYAGTGKTTGMLGPTVKIIESLKDVAGQSDVSIIGMSTMNVATDELRKSTGVTAYNLTRFIKQIAKSEEFKNDKRRQIWLVDESGMTANEMMRDLLAIAATKDALVVNIGDKLQNPGVGAGKIFAVLQDAGMTTEHMADIVRQKHDSEIYRSVKAMIQGNAKEALEHISSYVRAEPNNDKRLDRIVADYFSHSAAERVHMGIATPARARVNELNSAVHDERKARGELSVVTDTITVLEQVPLAKVDRLDPRFFNVGEIVRFDRAYKVSDISKPDAVHQVKGKSYLKVVAREKSTLVLERDNGTLVRWQPRQGVSVFTERKIELGARDEIMVRATDRKRNLHNAKLGTIVNIYKGIATIELRDSKEIVQMNLQDRKDQHLDYAYAFTIDAVQGSTFGKKFIAEFNSNNRNIVHENALYVGISRAKSIISLYTDEVEKLVNRAALRAKKYSALETTKAKVQERVFDQNDVKPEIRYSADDVAAKAAAEAARKGRKGKTPAPADRVRSAKKERERDKNLPSRVPGTEPNIPRDKAKDIEKTAAIVKEVNRTDRGLER